MPTLPPNIAAGYAPGKFVPGGDAHLASKIADKVHTP